MHAQMWYAKTSLCAPVLEIECVPSVYPKNKKCVSRASVDTLYLQVWCAPWGPVEARDLEMIRARLAMKPSAMRRAADSSGMWLACWATRPAEGGVLEFGNAVVVVPLLH